MTKPELKERVEQLERLLADARAERDKYEQAIRWALGYSIKGPIFEPRKPGDPTYWWRRTLSELSGVL